ncbi:MAG: MFS transporter [Candidatus Gracilibacteria bacterium]|nr:MFS transporter [Candidatus Gracilibacteria bacterium]
MSNYVSVESSFDEIRRKNFFHYGFISSFVWMCFHFTLVFFFLLQLKSALIVGIFLGLGNFISFLVDSPVGVIQKYFNAKKIFIASATGMLIVSVIFLYFIWSAGSVDMSLPKDILSKTMLTKIISSIPNVLLLVISVILYGVIKELSDVTSLSYIMNNADPSEYAELLSKNNIFSGLGALVGLVLSGVILAFNSFVAVSILVVIVSIFILFITKYFDNSNDSINFKLEDIKKLKLISAKETIESVKQYTVTQVGKTDFGQVKQGVKFIFLKPLELKNSINFEEIKKTTIEDLKSFQKILFKAPYSHKLIIMGLIVTLFGFWDTFVTTFLIDFLNNILNQNKDNFIAQLMTGYIFIAVLAVPAYGAQIPLIGLSKKIGTFTVTLAGVLISGISVLFFGFFNTFIMVLILGVLNSLGYAAAMPLSQSEFSDEYNQVYAEKNKLSEIDSNASSAPLKMVLNLANVVGLVVGGALVTIFGYIGTFIVFGLFLISLFAISIIKKAEWKL